MHTHKLINENTLNVMMIWKIHLTGHELRNKHEILYILLIN